MVKGNTTFLFLVFNKDYQLLTAFSNRLFWDKETRITKEAIESSSYKKRLWKVL